MSGVPIVRICHAEQIRYVNPHIRLSLGYGSDTTCEDLRHHLKRPAFQIELLKFLYIQNHSHVYLTWDYLFDIQLNTNLTFTRLQLVKKIFCCLFHWTWTDSCNCNHINAQLLLFGSLQLLIVTMIVAANLPSCNNYNLRPK